jgi:hypothetical protein
VVAVVVFGLTAFAETAIEAWANHAGWILTTVVGAVAIVADLLGEIFFVGVLDRLVGEAHGRPAQSPLRVLRTLPYRPLILADVLVAILVVVGLLAFVVPGVIAFTFVCLSAPIVNIERRSALSALRRSAQLVRGCFKLTFFLVTVPFFVADWVGTSLEDTIHALPFVEEFALHLAITIVIAVVTGLFQVELAHRLIDLDTGRPRATNPA